MHNRNSSPTPHIPLPSRALFPEGNLHCDPETPPSRFYAMTQASIVRPIAKLEFMCNVGCVCFPARKLLFPPAGDIIPCSRQKKTAEAGQDYHPAVSV